MTAVLRAACVQVTSTPDIAANVDAAAGAIRAAAERGAKLVALPENVALLGPRKVMRAHAGDEDHHGAVRAFRAAAAASGVWLLAGSVAVAQRSGRLANRSLLIDDGGAIVARYDKIHMFDVDLEGGESYRESETYAPGEQAVVTATPWGPLGLSVCYDLRFPHLYRALAEAGARLLAIPSAFTRPTGAAHWHVLLRARAIETGCFVLAPAQCGVHYRGRAT